MQLVEEAKLKDISIKYRKKIFLDKFSQQKPHQVGIQKQFFVLGCNRDKVVMSEISETLRKIP